MAIDNIRTNPTLPQTDESQGPWRLVWKRFKKNKMATIGAYIFITILLLVIIIPIISPHPIGKMNLTESGAIDRNAPPSLKFWLGTDGLGRDIMVRLFYGGRISLALGITATIISVTIGTLLGGIAGYFGGFVDNILMRFAEIIHSVPILPIVISISALLSFVVPASQRMYIVMIVFGLFGWANLARLVRGQILSLREQEFMQATEILGISNWSKITKHLIPNVLGLIIVAATFGLVNGIMAEVILSFIGMGFPPPTPTWGNMIPTIYTIHISRNSMLLWLTPGIMLALTTISINMLGEGLRDAFDPKEEGR